jgi:hypothetical protein
MLRSLAFAINADDTLVSDAKLDGINYLVVPVVSLIEGVLHPSSSENAELALASEFGKFPESWNGRPVILDHPKDEDGIPVSANSPDIWEESVVGFVFNTVLDGKKLKSEMWINKDKAGEELLDRFQDEDSMVEVSTGLYADTEEKKGRFNGEKYQGIWRNIVPDHLAILPEGTLGACSVEDGCGAPRINAQATKRSGTIYTLSAASTKEFAQAQKDMKAACGCEKGPKVDKKQGIFQKAVSALKDLGLDIFKDRSDRDVRGALQAALDAKLGNETFQYVMDVFPDEVIYYHSGNGTVRRSYSIDDNGAITLGEEVEQVRAETEYVPVVVNDRDPTTQGADMDPKQQNQQQAGTQAPAGPTAADMAAIASETATKILAEAEAKRKAEAEAKAAEEAKQLEAARIAKVNASPEAYVEAAPEQFRGTLKSALEFFNSRKTTLIKGLSGKTKMSEDELKLLDPAMLEKLADAVGLEVNGGTQTTFAGANAPALNANAGKQDAFTPPMQVFPIKSLDGKDKAA